MLRILVYITIAHCFLFVVSPGSCAAEFYVAGWNVENLFDLQDDPEVEYDEDFTPQSPKKWTKERLEIKLKNLADAIGKMNNGNGPDVLGLCEVENRKVVEMLREKLAPLGRRYEILHKDSPSDRGIDCALLYDADVFGLADSKFHFVDAEKTRDIIEARLHRDSGDLFVFVNHWPSRHNDEWQRLKAADVLRKRLDEILAADPKADIVMVGDFNDEPDNIALRDNLRAAKSKDNLPAGALFDTTAFLEDDKQGTFVFDNKWELIDHIIISPGLLDDAGYRWKDDSSERIDRDELIYRPQYPNVIPRPSTSYTRNDFHKNGYSDHLALGCVIVE
ncbi:MAG: endonuclease/exonuclease/phosphatase family protein [Planctomycetes bacterium]|nr:endonuclease/exonuclease/phosphatase family protein [Planctomycetota bacterium]